MRLTRESRTRLRNPFSAKVPAVRYENVGDPSSPASVSGSTSTVVGRATFTARAARLTTAPEKSPWQDAAGRMARTGTVRLELVDERERDVCRRDGIVGDEHHAVADELDDSAAAFHDDLRRGRVERAQGLRERRQIELLGPRGRVDEVGEADAPANEIDPGRAARLASTGRKPRSM